MADARQYAPATARNRDPILKVLQSNLPSGLVLEIASGTGEHGTYFTQQWPHWVWQPTDMNTDAIASIQAWRTESQCDRLLAPFLIDVQAPQWWLPIPETVKTHLPLTAIVNINMIHISPWSATEGLFQGAAALLSSGGFFYLYGPYQIGGKHTSESNAQFDQSLRRRNPAWGIRNLEEVIELGQRYGLNIKQRVQMPANNQSIILAMK